MMEIFKTLVLPNTSQRAEWGYDDQPMDESLLAQIVVSPQDRASFAHAHFAEHIGASIKYAHFSRDPLRIERGPTAV